MNEFNPFNHKYYIDGVEVPSVSSLIPTKFFVSENRLEECRQEGTKNHLAVKKYLSIWKIPEGPHRGYIETFQKFLDDTDFKVLEFETPGFNNKLMFAGTPDLIGTSFGKKIILDLKRSFGDEKKHSLQLAGYDLLKYINADEWWILVINGGDYKVKKIIPTKEAVYVFRGLVQKYWAEYNYNKYTGE